MTEFTTQQLTEARRDIKQAIKYPPFDEHQAGHVLSALAAGNPISDVVKWPGYPSARIVKLWREINPDFDACYLATLEERADALAERGLTVASDQTRDPACRNVESKYCQWLAGRFSSRYASRGAEGATLVQNTQINVAGDVNLSPADAYKALLSG